MVQKTGQEKRQLYIIGDPPKNIELSRDGSSMFLTGEKNIKTVSEPLGDGLSYSFDNRPKNPAIEFYVAQFIANQGKNKLKFHANLSPPVNNQNCYNMSIIGSNKVFRLKGKDASEVIWGYDPGKEVFVHQGCDPNIFTGEQLVALDAETFELEKELETTVGTAAETKQLNEDILFFRLCQRTLAHESIILNENLNIPSTASFDDTFGQNDLNPEQVCVDYPFKFPKIKWTAQANPDNATVGKCTTNFCREKNGTKSEKIVFKVSGFSDLNNIADNIIVSQGSTALIKWQVEFHDGNNLIDRSEMIDINKKEFEILNEDFKENHDFKIRTF